MPSLFLWKKTSFTIKYIFGNIWKQLHHVTFWAVFLWILQYLFQIPQNPTIFYTFFHKIAPFLHVYYTKFDKKFSFFENFGFSQKFPVGIGFFQSIKVVNIIFECWKVKNVQSNKVDITSYSWTVWKKCIFKRRNKQQTPMILLILVVAV